MGEQMDFFEKNDEIVCDRLVKVLAWMTLVFPVLFITTALGVFQIRFVDLAILTPIGCACTLGPGIARRAGVPAKIMKYVSVLAVGVVVMLLGGNSAIGIYMTYGLAMLFSCMFFDRKFTKQIAVISYFLLVFSLFLRSQNVQQIEYPTNMEWFITRALGFTIEQVVMSVVFVSVAGGSRKILENLHTAEQMGVVVEKCEEASTKLVGAVDNLAGNMQESKEVNDRIVDSARNASDDCTKSLEHTSLMKDSIGEMTQAAEAISESTQNLLDISDDIWQRMEHYVEIMDDAVGSMKDIEEKARLTSDSVQDLEQGIDEISGLAQEISNITSQTNLLSLNASIEAARAGEHGRGFAVVADEIRSLADNSKAASASIAVVVSKILDQLDGVKVSNGQNLTSVATGIRQISDARQEVEKLGQLQEDSKKRAEQIAETSNLTREKSLKVNDMAGQMEELVQSSLARANSIVDETNSQAEIRQKTELFFSDVKYIAEDLLEISKINEEQEHGAESEDETDNHTAR